MNDLHAAVESGGYVRVKNILIRDPSCVNDRNRNYETPLHVLCRVNGYTNISILQLLLDYGADVNAVDDLYITPLSCVTFFNQIEVIKLLLERGADPNFRDYHNHIALHGLLDSSDTKHTVKLLLQYGAEINAVDSLGKTPLDEAIKECNFNTARILMDAGGRFNVILNFMLRYDDVDRLCMNYDYDAPLCDNAKKQMRFLIHYGAEIPSDRRFSARALYFRLTREWKPKYIEELMLEEGIAVDDIKCEGEGMSELHVAVKEEDVNQVEALLQAGADVNAKNVLDETPLHVLFHNDVNDNHERSYSIARLLIEAGANLDTRNYNYFPTASQVDAHYVRNLRIMNLMLAKMSGVEESTLRIKTELSGSGNYMKSIHAIAIELGYKEVIDRLIEMGHIKESSDLKWRPPLWYSVKGRDYEITKTLLEVGCKYDESYPHGIPWLDLEEWGTDDLKLICLLWEFDCFSILRRAISIAFWYIIEPSDTNKIVLLDLLLFYYKIGLHTNKLNQDFISMRGYHSNERLTTVLASYDVQIDKLKKDQICGNKSKFDLLAMKLDSLVNFLNDENNIRVIEELRSSLGDDGDIESYELAMKVRIGLAIERRKLLDSAKDCLNEAFQHILDFVKVESLPDEIISSILSYLNIRELKKIAIIDKKHKM